MDEFRRLKAMYPNASSRELSDIRFLRRRWRDIRKIQKTDVAARTAEETIAKTVVTTSGGEDTALARTPGTPASAAPVTDLLRDPGGEIKVIVPATALAPSTLAETIDVVVTGVLEEEKVGLLVKIRISSPINRADTTSCTPSPKTKSFRALYSTSPGPKRNWVRKIRAPVRGLIPPQSERKRKS